MATVPTADYRALAAFRYEIRKFLAFSEHAARDAGIEPKQHQLLLALRGLPADQRPTLGTLAERLCVKPHTAVALADKLEARGMLVRRRSTRDRREVLLAMTPKGAALLRRLSAMHREQLRRVGPGMVAALHRILGDAEDGAGADVEDGADDGADEANPPEPAPPPRR